VSVSSQESERSYIYMSYGYRCCLFYDFSIRFWNCSNSVIYFAIHFIPDRRVSFYLYLFYIISSYFYIYHFSIGFGDFTNKYGLVFCDFHPMTNFVWEITLEWQLCILWRHVIFMCILTQGNCLQIACGRKKNENKRDG
jgi:hypothetical protein